MEKNLKEEFFVHLANNLFLDSSINFDVYSKECTYTIKGKHYLGKSRFSNILYLDSDGVLNAEGYEGVSSTFYKILSEINSRVKQRFDDIKSILSTIMQISRAQGNLILEHKLKTFSGPEIERILTPNSELELEKSVDKLEQLLKECNVSEEEFRTAGFYAAESTPFVNNIFYALSDLENELGYKIYIVSAGPDAAIEEQGKRLQVSGVKSSRFKFNHGRLVEIVPCVGVRKKVDDRDYEACVFVTDDWSADFRIASTFNLGFVGLVTDDSREFPYKIYAKLPELRKDFSKLPEFVRRYHWARVYAEVFSPSSIKAMRNIIKHIKNLSHKNNTLEDLKAYLNTFINFTNPVFPENSYELKKLLQELETTDTENHKKIISEIIGRINEVPIAKASEKFDRELEKFEVWEHGIKP